MFASIFNQSTFWVDCCDIRMGCLTSLWRNTFFSYIYISCWNYLVYINTQIWAHNFKKEILNVSILFIPFISLLLLTNNKVNEEQLNCFIHMFCRTILFLTVLGDGNPGYASQNMLQEISVVYARQINNLLTDKLHVIRETQPTICFFFWQSVRFTSCQQHMETGLSLI